MKVLSLHEPWATLVRLGIKTLETRTWTPPEKLIGERIAIASTQRKPKWGVIGDYRVEPAYEDVRHVEGCYCEPGAVAPECARPSKGRPVLTKDERVVSELPLGAIVTTCTLVDVVPITVHADVGDPECIVVHEGGIDHCIPLGPQVPPQPHPNYVVVRLDAPEIEEGAHLIRDVTDQRPYGDFTPGRFAWLLADVVPVDPPVPFRGGQRLTREWEPA